MRHCIFYYILVIGTFLIQEVTITEGHNQNNCLELNISYSEIQPANSGVLVMLIPKEGGIENSSYFSLLRQFESREDMYLLRPIGTGNYHVLLYDINQRGLIISGLSVITTTASITQGKCSKEVGGE